MLFNEYLENNDLFGTINGINPYAFINDNSNVGLAFMFGDRTVSDNVTNLDIVTVSELIIERFGDKWNSLIDTAITDFKLGSVNTVVNESTTTKQTDSSGNTNNLNKITGFNDIELITDTGVTAEDAKSETGISTKVNSKYQLNLKSLFNNLKMIDKTNIIKTVQDDVTSYLTIYIY